MTTNRLSFVWNSWKIWCGCFSHQICRCVRFSFYKWFKCFKGEGSERAAPGLCVTVKQLLSNFYYIHWEIIYDTYKQMNSAKCLSHQRRETIFKLADTHSTAASIDCHVHMELPSSISSTFARLGRPSSFSCIAHSVVLFVFSAACFCVWPPSLTSSC